MSVQELQFPPYMTGVITQTKRKVFVSYHHAGDQSYCDWFRTNLGEELDLFTDRSLDEPVRSNDAEYINRRIREDYILGSSATIVLCGSETYKRKYVDWEIHSTLHYKHALLGIALPTAVRGNENKIIVPNRLHENIQSGYAHWVNWDQNWLLYPSSLKTALDVAIQRSSNTHLIRNSPEKMARNLS